MGRSYPKEIYDKITDDPASWLGKETKWEAVLAAQEEYDCCFRPNWEIVGILAILAGMIAVCGIALIASIFLSISL